MEEDKKGSRIFYGWWIMLGAALCGFVCSGAMNTLSAAAPHLEDKFGWSTAVITAAAGVGVIVMGVVGVGVGYLVDRIGPRRTVIIGAVIAGIGYMLVSLTTADALWMWYLCIGFIGPIGLAFAMMLAPLSTLRRWFMKRAALTMSMAMVGSGLGVVVLVPFVYSPLIEAFGWEKAYLVCGFILLVGALIGGALLRKDPESHGMYPDGVKPDPELLKERLDFMARGEEWLVGEAARNRNFWLLILAQLGGIVAIMGIYPHLFLWGESPDVGLTAEGAGVMMAAFAGTAIVGRVLAGFVSDWYMARFPGTTRKPILYVNILGVLLGLVLCATIVDSYATMLLALIVVGFSYGIGISIFPTYLGDLFGVVNIPRLFGFMFLFIVPFGALAPYIFGRVYDAMGSYDLAFYIGAVLCAVSVVTLALVRQPQKRPLSEAGAQSS